jgi:hypothetical protein
MLILSQMKVGYFFIVLFFSISGLAQQDFISALRVDQMGNQVRIDLVISAGISYCVGIDLERSSDGENFEVIDQITGICGGSEFEEAYSMFDETPIYNQLSYYRLNLGTVGRSETLPIFFVPLKDGLLTFPNPANTSVQIKFDNPENRTFQIEIFKNDQLHYFKNALVGNEYLLSTEAYAQGTYHFKITFESGRQYKGRFVVVKS